MAALDHELRSDRSIACPQALREALALLEDERDRYLARYGSAAGARPPAREPVPFVVALALLEQERDRQLARCAAPAPPLAPSRPPVPLAVALGAYVLRAAAVLGLHGAAITAALVAAVLFLTLR